MSSALQTHKDEYLCFSEGPTPEDALELRRRPTPENALELSYDAPRDENLQEISDLKEKNMRRKKLQWENDSYSCSRNFHVVNARTLSSSQ